jgi:hypothetical protein
MHIHEVAAARKMLLFVSYFNHAKHPAEKITIGVPILWHLLNTFSHCCAAKTGEVFAANFEVLTPPAENAKMAPVFRPELAVRSIQRSHYYKARFKNKGAHEFTRNEQGGGCSCCRDQRGDLRHGCDQEPRYSEQTVGGN